MKDSDMVMEMVDIVLKPMELKDVEKFRHWSTHDDELFSDYNFLPKTDKEVREWYEWKVGSLFSEYFCIIEGEIPIGYLGMKGINFLFRTSFLGIVLDPGKVNQGYGEVALRKFLKYYFEEKNMKKIFLHVAPYNKRAFSLYKKIGFQTKGTFPYIYPNGKPPLYREEFQDIWDLAIELGGHWILRGIRMELSQEEYWKGAKE
ncbi:MAG: GNAT family protein [Tissierellia bacterium]|nr:GNAT family protein [Tissierellia bacterium]